tara:strand:+ start:1798 stop:1995 length:198 start_codon:yes stop_codon:yes gene_type:complete
MKVLLLILALFTLTVLFVISNALVKDIIDTTTGKKVPDREGKILGIVGYIVCAVLAYIIYRMIFD